MKLYIGADHNGYTLKGYLMAYLRRNGHEVVDATDGKLDPDDDYPQVAGHTVTALLADDGLPTDEARAILLCGSGQGVCMAANRFKRIRAAVSADVEAIRAGRNDDDVNVLCLPARQLSNEQAEKLVQLWLTTPFAGADRYKRRVRELDHMGF